MNKIVRFTFDKANVQLYQYDKGQELKRWEQGKGLVMKDGLKLAQWR